MKLGGGYLAIEVEKMHLENFPKRNGGGGENTNKSLELQEIFMIVKLE